MTPEAQTSAAACARRDATIARAAAAKTDMERDRELRVRDAAIVWAAGVIRQQALLGVPFTDERIVATSNAQRGAATAPNEDEKQTGSSTPEGMPPQPSTYAERLAASMAAIAASKARREAGTAANRNPAASVPDPPASVTKTGKPQNPFVVNAADLTNAERQCLTWWSTTIHR